VGALIGLGAAGEEGAELALAELACTGAFDRSHLLLVRRPVWLADGQRGRGVPEHMQLAAADHLVQTAMDAANAMVSVPGEFGSFGHDYRADMVHFVRDADAPPADQGPPRPRRPVATRPPGGRRRPDRVRHGRHRAAFEATKGSC
jgi:uncharacterized membrane protein